MISKKQTYKLNQWKISFTTLFVSTTLVLAMFAISLLLRFSFNNIKDYFISNLEIEVELVSTLTPIESFQVRNEIEKAKIIKSIALDNSQKQIKIGLNSSQLKDLEALDKYVEQIKGVKGVNSVLYPEAITKYILSASDFIKKTSTLLVFIIGIIGYFFLYIIIRILIYSKRYPIYNMKLVGATKKYIYNTFIIKNLWCSLAAGLFTSVILSLAAFTLTLTHPDTLLVIDIKTFYFVLLLTPILGVIVNVINTRILVNKTYKLNRKQLNSI